MPDIPSPISGLTMKLSGISRDSPGASVCCEKQKHSILSKCCAPARGKRWNGLAGDRPVRGVAYQIFHQLHLARVDLPG